VSLRKKGADGTETKMLEGGQPPGINQAINHALFSFEVYRNYDRKIFVLKK
jgi:hypothetical protein